MPGTFRATVTMLMMSKMCGDSQAPTLVGGSNAGTCTSIRYEYLNIHNYYPPSVAKRIAPSASGSNQDLNLNDNYYVLYGRRRAASGAGTLFPHEQGPTNNPSISSSTVNPTGPTDMISGPTAPVRS